jgi:hypothetical protein
MTKKRQNIGVVIIDVSDIKSKKNIVDLIKSGIKDVPDGRSLVIMWESKNNWILTVPVESIATETVLGQIKDRGSEYWEFFGNGVARIYRKDLQSVESNMNWIIFRKDGEKAYKRRHVADATVVNESRLSTLHPVFTRDVSNNVWHLPSSRAKNQIVLRFKSLLSWSDEIGILHSSRGRKTVKHEPLIFEKDLIGKAAKVSYGYFLGEILFES